MAEQEEKPKRHFTFTNFSTLNEDSLSPELIRETLLDNIEKYKGDIQYQTQGFEEYKTKAAEEKKDLEEQKVDLAKDPKAYYNKMLARRDAELTELNAAYPDKSNPEYTAKATAINAKYAGALDKDTLDRNPDAYTNANFDRLESSVEKNNKRLDMETSKFNGKIHNLNNHIGDTNRHIQILDKDPEAFAKLNEIKKFSENDENVDKVGIGQSAKGQPCLAVVLKNAGIPTGFVISDGKITFNQDSIDKMTVETMRGIIDYLDRRGISGIEMPSDIDQKLAEMYEKAAAENAQQEQNDAQTQEEVPPENFGERDRSQDERRGITTTTLDPNKVDYKKAYDNIDEWIFGKDGLNKANGWDAFKKTTWDGYDVWTLYDNGNFKNEELDGKVDKEGYMKVKYAFKLYAKKIKDEKGNEVLELSYAMPNKKKVNDDYAKGMMRMMKMSGITHVNLPEGMQESDQGSFRIACASNGIVPKLKNLSESKIAKMLEEAKSKLSDKDLLTYKLRLAEWMEKCAQEDCMKNGTRFKNHKNASIIGDLRGEYDYTPFRNMYEKGGGIKDVLSEIIDKNKENDKDGAVKIAGATYAVRDMFDVYKNNHSKDIGTVLNEQFVNIVGSGNLEKFKSDFMKNLSEDKELMASGYKFDPSKKMRDMDPEEIGALYKAIVPYREAKAAKTLENKFIKSVETANSGGAATRDSTLVTNLLGGARDELNEVNKTLKVSGVKEIYLPNLGSPDHDFKQLRKEHPLKRDAQKNQKQLQSYDDDGPEI